MSRATDEKVNGSVVYGSMAEVEEAGAGDVEYRTIPGFKAGQSFRIGSLTAGDLIEWTEANEGEAKRTAGLRLITKSLVDINGRRYADDPANVEKFRKFRHKETERVVKEILHLNGMQTRQENDAKNA